MILCMYNWHYNTIANLLNDHNVIRIAASPTAHQVIVTMHTMITDENFLSILLSKCCPFLDSISMDVTLEITLLKLHHNNAIHLSFEHVQGTDMKIKYSSESIEKTRLLKFYLKALSLSPSHYYLIHHFISNLNIHIITYGLGIEALNIYWVSSRYKSSSPMMILSPFHMKHIPFQLKIHTLIIFSLNMFQLL